MISCTEFIPSYSELFTYIEDHHGRDAVTAFWNYLFEPDGKGIPLIGFVQREGIRGCFSYWKGTLNEEAADFTMYLNEKAGWFMNVMHHCPSKGRLLALEKTIGIKPYCDYCLHCDGYRHAVKLLGLDYVFNTRGIENAACSMLIYDPKVFDGRVIIDENTEIMDRKASQNEYFHRDFHSSLNMGVDYLAKTYGFDELKAYLTQYTRNVYAKRIGEIKAGGLSVLKDMIENTYRLEHASDAAKLTLTDDGLDVEIAYCPGVKHLRATGRTVSDQYVETTRIVMQTIADETGYRFRFDAYDPETGAAKYGFSK